MPNSGERHFQSFALTILTAVAGYVGYEVNNTSKQVTALSEKFDITVDGLKGQIADVKLKITEVKTDNVRRDELALRDLRIEAIEKRLDSVERAKK